MNKRRSQRNRQETTNIGNNFFKKFNESAGSFTSAITYPVRDVVITSLNKGQFLPVGGFLIIAYIIHKIPSNQIVEVIKGVKYTFIELSFIAWILVVLLVLGWFLHYKITSRVNARELNRVLEEKEKLQQQLFKLINDKSN